MLFFVNIAVVSHFSPSTSRFSMTLSGKSTSECRLSPTRPAVAPAALHLAARVADYVKWFVSMFSVFSFQFSVFRFTLNGLSQRFQFLVLDFQIMFNGLS